MRNADNPSLLTPADHPTKVLGIECDNEPLFLDGQLIHLAIICASTLKISADMLDIKQVIELWKILREWQPFIKQQLVPMMLMGHTAAIVW